MSGIHTCNFDSFVYYSIVFFRWAVSAVMTRQNLAPAHDGSGKVTNVLIPLWDMCNHTNGRVSCNTDLLLINGLFNPYAPGD